MAVGFSMKQGTKEIRTAADNIQNCLSELIGPHSHKILFMLIPRPIRQFIPLKYWPCKYFNKIKEISNSYFSNVRKCWRLLRLSS